MILKERDILKTGGYSDVEMAMKFHDDFSTDGEFIGKVIDNESFNDWIASLNFSTINHGWDTVEGAKAFNGYRSTVRGYLKNGVMSEVYAEKVINEGKYKPYVLNVRKFGQDLIIVAFTSYVIDSAAELAKKRKKTVKNQTKHFKEHFQALTEKYGNNSIDVQIKNQLVNSHNELRMHMESAFDKMFEKTTKDALQLIETTTLMKKSIEFLNEDSEPPKELNEKYECSEE